MQFFRCSRVALLVSGALLASLSLPLAQFRGEQIDIRFNESVVFSGELRALAGAYLPLAALLSLGAGGAGFSLAAWRQTSQRLKQSQRQVETLEGLVQQRDRQLQAAQLSPLRLEQVGLDYFLSHDDDDDDAQTAAPVQKIGAVGQVAQQRTHVSLPSPRPVAQPAAPLRYLAVAQSLAPQDLQNPPMAASAENETPSTSLQDANLQDAAAPQRPSFLVINPYQPQAQVPSSRPMQAPTRRAMSTQRSAWPS